MFLIAVLLVVIIVYRQFKAGTYRTLNPVSWFIIGFITIALFYIFSGIEWGTPLQWDTIVYLLLVGVFIYFGYWLGYRTDKYRRIDRDTIIKREQSLNEINTFKYALISIVSGILWLTTMIANNNIEFGFRLESYTQSLVSQVSLIFIGFSLFVWVYELLKAILSDKVPKLYACICLAVYLIPNLVYAGRQCILVGGFSTLLTFIYATRINKKYKYKKQSIGALIGLLGLVTIYFMFITEVREGVVDRVRMYEVMFNSHTSDQLKTIVDRMGPFKKIFLQLDYYYSSVLPGFEALFKNYDGPICLGAFQFQYISRRFPGYIGSLNELARENIKSLSNNLFMYDAIYRTYLRGFIIDFGRIGAVLASGLCAFWLGKSRRHYLKYRNEYNTVLQIILCAGMLHAIEYSPLYDGNTWAYSFYMTLFVGLYERNRRKIRIGRFKV